MKNKFLTHYLPILVVVVIIAQIVYAMSDTGIAGRTGSPGETNCRACHTGNVLNASGGSISITSNIPSWEYTPGAVYTINVTVARTGFTLWGLGVEALNSSNTNAGTFIITNTTTTRLLNAANGRSNVTHRLNVIATGTYTFSFNWRAPATNVGNVTFYVAGMAANKNGANSGDYVYTTTQVSTPNNLTITTGNINGNLFCAGTTGIKVPYTAVGNYIAGNVFTAQLSDANGSFTSPLSLGTITSLVSDTIVTTTALPAVQGTGYRIRVVSNSPVITGTDNGTDITIKTVPTTANAGSDTEICADSTTLAGNTPSAGTGTWSLVSGTGNFVSPNSPSSAVTGLSTGFNTFVWTIDNSPCGISTDTVTVKVIPQPTVANAGADLVLCDSVTTITGNVPSVGTGEWSVVSGTANIVSPSTNSSAVNGIGAGDALLVWSISNGVCTSSVDTIKITRKLPVTPANAGADHISCLSTSQMHGNVPAIGNGTWSVIAGTGVLTSPDSANSMVTSLSAGVNTFVWTISNAPCAASSDTVNINFSGTITASDAGPDQTICTNTTTLAANIVTTGSGVWRLVSGAGTFTDSLSPTTTVTGISTGTNIYNWYITNGSCDASWDEVNVTLLAPATVANAGADILSCTGTAVMTANTPSVGTGKWKLISGAGTCDSWINPVANVTGLGTGNNVFRWVISNPPCDSTYDEVTITFNGVMSTANAGADQVVCGSSATLSANVPAVGKGKWTVASGTAVFSADSVATASVTGLSTGVNQLVWTITSGACNPSSDTVQITSVTAPTAANAGADQFICDTTTTLAANNPTSGTGQWSVVSGTATVTNPTSPTSTVTGIGTGIIKLVWTISNSPCSPSVDTMMIDYTCATITTSAIANSTFCVSTGYQVEVPFSTTGTFTGFYSAQLSDTSGAFTNPVVIGASTSSPIYATIPSSTLPGSKYRIRVVNSSPAIAGTDNGTDLSINDCDSLITGDIQGSPFCASTTYQVSVPFYIIGLTGYFIAQLSDASGSFDSPRTIGYGTTSPIAATIPSATVPGINYRIRVRHYDSGILSAANKQNLNINSCTTGITMESGSSSSYIIYPNPTDGNLYIETKGEVSLSILNELGQVVRTLAVSNTELPVEVKDLNAGIYYLIGQIGGNTVREKIVVY